MRRGIIAMSARPYHCGHDAMIRRAARECDQVTVFASMADRRRAGELVPVMGRDMRIIWDELVLPTLPANVDVSFGGSPVGNVWHLLRGDLMGPDEYVIYAGQDDLDDSFTDKLLWQYGSHLMVQGRIKREATQRLASGSEMRAALARGDRAAFVAQLPASIDASRVWDVLSATARDPPRVKTTSKARRHRESRTGGAKDRPPEV